MSADVTCPPAWPADDYLDERGRLVAMPVATPAVTVAAPTPDTFLAIIDRKDPVFIGAWGALIGFLLAALVVGAAALMVVG